MKSKRFNYGNGTFSWEFEITDMSEEIKAAAKEQVLRALSRIGSKMHEYAVKLVPVKTTALRDSIAFRVDPDEPAVYIGSNSEYATYVELGTGEYSEVGGTAEKRWAYQDELTGEWRIGTPQKPRRFIKETIGKYINARLDMYLKILRD